MSAETNAGSSASVKASAAVEIRVEGVHKAFGDHRVLRGVDLEIRAGEFIAIVGGSGCGKTVLLNMILGILTPDAGRVRVAYHRDRETSLVDLVALTDPEVDFSIHTHWGVVFQNNALFSGTVLDNVGLWLREVRNLNEAAIRPIVQHALASVALGTDADFLETDVGSLSGGMQKRLAVARALAMDPIVMFFDEPTTGLDPVTASQIQDLILETHGARSPGAETRTTVVITHDKDLLGRLKPRTVMLHEGTVAFDGPFTNFEASDSPIIKPYFELMPVIHRGEPVEV